MWCIPHQMHYIWLVAQDIHIILQWIWVPKLSKSSEPFHYYDVIMAKMASQITSRTIVYSTVYSDVDQSKHQSSAPLAFVRGIHRGPVNSPHKWPVTRKSFPFDDVTMHNNYRECISRNIKEVPEWRRFYWREKRKLFHLSSWVHHVGPYIR